MKVITKVEMLETEYGNATLERFNYDNILSGSPNREPQRYVSYEHIAGQAFVDLNGKRTTIGWTKEVGEQIGIALETYSCMREEINTLKESEHALRVKLYGIEDDINRIITSGFWKRLKWLLTGIK